MAKILLTFLMMGLGVMHISGDEAFLNEFCKLGLEHGKGKPDGDYQNPRDCGEYITCIDFEHPGNRNARAYVRPCPSGLLFSDEIRVCAWPRDVKCFIDHGKTCFGAKGNKFGKFRTTQNGVIRSVKLVSLSGYVTCNKNRKRFQSKWGCNSNALKNRVNIYITTTANRNGIIVPEPPRSSNALGYYKLAGVANNDPNIIWELNSKNAQIVRKNQQLRIWYGEDLFNKNQGNNDGKHCVKVLVSYSYIHPYYFSKHML